MSLYDSQECFFVTSSSSAAAMSITVSFQTRKKGLFTKHEPGDHLRCLKNSPKSQTAKKNENCIRWQLVTRWNRNVISSPWEIKQEASIILLVLAKLGS
jgi:hypothetical protein